MLLVIWGAYSSSYNALKDIECGAVWRNVVSPSWEHLEHKPRQREKEKGCKMDAVRNMPEQTDVSSFRSFLGSVQSYGKFIKHLFTLAAPLHQLTKKNTPWHWNKKAKDAFGSLKTILSNDTVLAHYNLS